MTFNLPFFKRNKVAKNADQDQPPSDDVVAKHLTGTLPNSFQSRNNWASALQSFAMSALIALVEPALGSSVPLTR